MRARTKQTKSNEIHTGKSCFVSIYSHNKKYARKYARARLRITMSADGNEKLRKFEESEKAHYEKGGSSELLDDTAAIFVSSQSPQSLLSFPPLFSRTTKKREEQEEQESREGRLSPGMLSPLTRSLAFTSPPYLKISSVGGDNEGDESFSPLLETFCEVLSPRAWMKKAFRRKEKQRRGRTQILPGIWNNCKVVAVNILFAFPVSIMALLFSSAVVPIISAHAALTAILFLSLSVAFEMLEILIQSLHSMDVQPYYREVADSALKSSMKEVKSYKRRVPLLFSTEKDDSDSQEEMKKEREGSSRTA